MSVRFQDHFSVHAGAYASSRPDYPDALHAWIASVAPSNKLAIDVGCGNGQAARGLARHFDAVLGTDASPEQIAACKPAERVRFAVAPAHRCPVPDGSADVLAAAQAAHWFEPDAFHAEARRVLQPGGILALWCYELFRVSTHIDAVMDHFHHQTLGADWPPERQHVDSGYSTLPFPFDLLEDPDFHLERQWSVDAVLAYLSTWSANRRYRARTGLDPLADLAPALREAWGPGERTVTWRLRIKAGKR